MNDVTKLPKWAQVRISNLESKLKADVAYWKGKAVEAETGDTNTFLGDYPDDIGLPRGSRIVFVLPSGRISADVRDDHLHLHARNGALVVQPVVTNAVNIRTEKW